METPTYVPDTVLPQSQQISSDLPLNLGSSQVNAKTSEQGALRYVCSICRASYAQRQGAWRHIRTIHYPKPCFRCGFKWGRPYEYRDHLKKKHPGVDPDIILGKAQGSRRRVTALTEYVPQHPPVSPPSVEQDQQNWAESQPYPAAPPSPTKARITNISPPAVSSVGYNLQPVYAEQAVTMDEHEYGTYPLVMVPPTEGGAKAMTRNYLDGQFGQFRLPPAHLGGSTAIHIRSNKSMALIHTLSPPVDENYGPLISKDPMWPFRPMRYSPFSETDTDTFFNAILTNYTL